jgi:hypothetical protein
MYFKFYVGAGYWQSNFKKVIAKIVRGDAQKRKKTNLKLIKLPKLKNSYRKSKIVTDKQKELPETKISYRKSKRGTDTQPNSKKSYRKSSLGDAAGPLVDLDDGADGVVCVLELRVVPVQVLQLTPREAVLVDRRRLGAARFLGSML